MASVLETRFLSQRMLSVRRQNLDFVVLKPRALSCSIWKGSKRGRRYVVPIRANQMHTPTSSDTTNQNDFRPLPNFPPSIWGTTFASFSFPEEEFKSYSRQVEGLKEEVHNMLMASTRDPVENIEFINLLCRLGVSYHFEDEIDMQLQHIFPYYLLKDNDYDLYTTALSFRVLRQHGYNMPCNVFNKFKEMNGEFKTSIKNDLKGILSLYEASFLSVQGEDILEEAQDFSRSILEQSLAMQLIASSPHLEEHIKNTLIRPFHKGIPRSEARQYISFYQKQVSVNETLLKFAKIDFNRVQLLHKQELSILSSWWRDINLAEKLPYARDRIVEVYFWANAVLSEPQYSFSRITTAKYITMMSVFDDTYDAYATIEEIKYLTDAMERCDTDASDQLPAADYMKFLYKTVVDLFTDTEWDTSKQGRSYCANFVREQFKDLVRSYKVEAQWSNDGYVPKFLKYMRNGTISTAFGVAVASAFTGMGKFAGLKEYEWLKSNPKIFETSKLIGCLMNDISGHEDEQKRGDCASSVECYMKEHNVSERELAIEEIKRMVENAWKDINNEFILLQNDIPMHVRKIFTNLARGCDVVYVAGEVDAYTNPLKLKDHVTSLFIDKVDV